MKTPLMNIIGNRRAVNEILAVGISLAAAATNIPRAEKVKAPTIVTTTNRSGFVTVDPSSHFITTRCFN